MSEKTVKLIVEGGKATSGPPLGTSLSPLGVNVLQVVEKINELTKEFTGMRVPVEVKVNIGTKEFQVSVGIPSISALIAREAGIEKGSGMPGRESSGNLTFEQVIKIANYKMPDMRASSLKSAVKQVLGSCISMGVTVEGKNPKDVIQEVNKGVYDKVLGG